MDCPRCKHSLAVKSYENVNVDHCTACGGFWLDAGEMQPILSARDILFSPELIAASLKDAHASIPLAEMTAGLHCPQCAAVMHALNYNYNSGVIINACSVGHGLWFDKEELERAQIFMEHWDDQEKQEKWLKLQKHTRQAETSKLSKAEMFESSKTGPVWQVIDAVIDFLNR